MIRRTSTLWRVASWALTLGVLTALPGPADAQSVPEECSFGMLGRAQILVCVPDAGWNHDLVVFAHGYVAPTEGLPQIPWDQLSLPDGTSIPGIMMSLGFAFATTSYSDDGLAVVPGIQDVLALVRYFETLQPYTDHVYLVGASEGGLVTTLAVEQNPLVFSGGLATCGPVGDFRRQVDYWGDFRVLFDYYFPPRWYPDLIPGTFPGPPCGADCTGEPPVDEQTWEDVYVDRITQALLSHPDRLEKILRVSRARFDPAEPATKVQTALGILWYSVFATQDAKKKLGGQPYDNSRRLYLGSGNDFWLNLLVKRYYADVPALAAIDAYYQTSGKLTAPLVTLHTTADPIVPYWHEPLYTVKALVNSGLLHTNIPVFRYGHCSFKAEEALVGLGLLILKVEGRELLNAERVLPTRQAQLRYRSLAKVNGLRR